MPTPAWFLVLATLLPLASFLLLLIVGRRMVEPLPGWVAIAFSAAGFALSMAATIAWYGTGELRGLTWGPGDKPIVLNMHLFNTSFIALTLHIDTLTIAMFNTITPVMTLAMAFAVRYLRGDVRFHKYFTCFQLLSLAMQGLVLSGNLWEITFFWALVGLGGYLLARLGRPSIGPLAWVWFVIYRFGDAAFLLAIVLLWRRGGDVMYPGIYLLGPTMPAGLAIFAAAAIRSGQYLFRPSPPAAGVMQSVTVSAAGVYLLARFYPVLTAEIKMGLAIVGLIGPAIGAILALREREIPRVFAWSTVSQMGLMFMALGLGNWTGALFLLLSHAFFKSLLVLTGGGIVHAAAGEKDLFKLGGLFARLPVCAVMLAIASLAMAGAPFTSGYYSLETIFIDAGSLAASRGGPYWLFFIVPAITAGLTGLYTTRLWMLVFWGKEPEGANYEKVRERTSFWFPLAALAILSLIGGSRLMDIESFVSQSADEAENYSNAMQPPASRMISVFDEQSNRLSDETGGRLFRRYATWPFAAGIVVGVGCFARGRRHSREAA